MKAAEKSWVANFSTRTMARAHWARVDGEHRGPCGWWLRKDSVKR